MDSTIAIAASGMRARMESLDMLANNIANASTGGYKADREFYSLYLAPEAADSDSPATMPVIERHWTDMSQGVLRVTGNPLDVALAGQGYLAVNGPAGTLYTRNGSLQLAADGRLVTAEGYAVRTTAGAELTLDATRPVEISTAGEVRQDGNVVGQIAVVDFAGQLPKEGNNYFAAPAALTPQVSTAVLQQGKLETSNTGSAEAAVRLVSVMRQFEMLQKAVGMANDMSRKAVEEVAKVGS
jgi:flagellar basal-body rod protein FlgF